jgi:hypothetical protein
MKTESEQMLAAKLTPPVAVAAAEMAGWTLQDWVLAATLFYTVMMILHHIVSKYALPLYRARKGRQG